jgi:predicted RNA-binding Zn-ribbon protein involved in translation (DUF1610 family)/uncharacterized membrane protein YozB (DUF420 family)
MHPQRIIAIVAATVGMVSVFFPWFEIVGLFQHTIRTGMAIGPVHLLPFIVSLILVLIGKQNEPFGGFKIFIVILNTIFLVITVLFISVSGEAGGQVGGVINVLFGVYLYLFCCLALCIDTFLFRKVSIGQNMQAQEDGTTPEKESANESQDIPTAPRPAQNRFVTFDCPHCGTTIYQRVVQCMFCQTALTDEVIDAAVEAYRARRGSR